MGFLWKFQKSKKKKNKQNFKNDTLSKETTQNEMEKTQNKTNKIK